MTVLSRYGSVSQRLLDRPTMKGPPLMPTPWSMRTPEDDLIDRGARPCPQCGELSVPPSDSEKYICEDCVTEETTS